MLPFKNLFYLAEIAPNNEELSAKGKIILHEILE